jgi:hypothetical protein
VFLIWHGWCVIQKRSYSLSTAPDQRHSLLPTHQPLRRNPWRVNCRVTSSKWLRGRTVLRGMNWGCDAHGGGLLRENFKNSSVASSSPFLQLCLLSRVTFYCPLFAPPRRRFLSFTSVSFSSFTRWNLKVLLWLCGESKSGQKLKTLDQSTGLSYHL